MRDKLVIGTRGSPLALWQARFVRDRLATLSDVQIEIITIRTTGDQHLEAPAAPLSRGIFVKEIEQALLAGEIDLAVHSMKDLPTEVPAGLTIGAVCARDDVRDVLISNDGSGLDQLPAGSLIGTSSLRRQAQLRARRPDLEPAEIRGNVDTRLRKLREGLFDAIVLAKAGLDRLGWSDQISEVFSTETMLPAVGQGAMGVEARADDAGVLSLLELVDHAPTRVAVMAERALLHELHGGCQIPVGAWGRTENDELVLDGGVISLDGRAFVRDRINGPPEQSVALGAQLAAKLLAQGADRILQGVNVYRATQHVSHDAFDS